MLDQVVHMAGHGRVLVDGSLRETVRRMKEGDGLLGWEGDPNIEVFVNLDPEDPACGTFDVWTLDAHDNPYMALSGKPYCDQRLIEDLLRCDERRSPLLARLLTATHAAQASARAAFREQMAGHDKLHWALTRDIGPHVTGLSRRLL